MILFSRRLNQGIKFQGQSEFQFSETGGEIGPYEVRPLHVSFRPHVPRSLKSFIECTVENGTGKCALLLFPSTLFSSGDCILSQILSFWFTIDKICRHPICGVDIDRHFRQQVEGGWRNSRAQCGAGTIFHRSWCHLRWCSSEKPNCLRKFKLCRFVVLCC